MVRAGLSDNWNDYRRIEVKPTGTYSSIFVFETSCRKVTEGLNVVRYHSSQYDETQYFGWLNQSFVPNFRGNDHEVFACKSKG